jgi:sugar phosphate isomerase/epimerase
MKIGTFIPIFDNHWNDDFLSLLDVPFDHFELLPENSKAYTRVALRQYLKNKEVILHAPFIEANLIAQNSIIRNASVKYYSKILAPLVDDYSPVVITLHLGRKSFLYHAVPLDAFRRLSRMFPSITFENQPYRPNLWRQSYPSTEEEVDDVLSKVQTRMTFDVGHWIIGGFDVYRLLEKYLSRIADIHIHDVADGKDHQALGRGVVDVEKFVSILKKRKYGGYLTIELIPENIQGVISSFKLLKKLL